MATKLSIIIFSKDRACQLDALLRSVEKQFKLDYEVHIIYSYSKGTFDAAYEGVWFLHAADNVHWIIETDFEKQVKRIIKKIKSPYTMFMVDDMVVKHEFAEDEIFTTFKNNKEILGLPLRLGRDIDADAKKKHTNIPLNSQNLWHWKDCAIKGWNYPMSIDGTMFRTTDLREYIQGLSFEKPNSFEAAMAKNPLQQPLLVCYDKAKTVNLAINKVQTEVRKNQCGEISENSLNKLWLKGYRIALEPLESMEHNQRHVILPGLEFEELNASTTENNTL